MPAQRRVQKAEIVEPLEQAPAGCFNGLRNLRLRFMQVNVHRHVQLIRKHPQLGE